MVLRFLIVFLKYLITSVKLLIIKNFISIITFIVRITFNDIQKDKDEELYYVVKYSSKEVSAFSVEDIDITQNITSTYYPFNYTISSTWGNIIDKLNSNKIYNSTFYYYLYDKGDNFYPNSICYMKSPSFMKLTKDTKIEITNKSFSGDGYDNVVIGHFYSVNNEEFLILFNSQSIAISSGNVYYWITGIFIALLLFVGYGTCRLYNEIKKRQYEEEETEKSIEINENNEDDLIINNDDE